MEVVPWQKQRKSFADHDKDTRALRGCVRTPARLCPLPMAARCAVGSQAGMDAVPAALLARAVPGAGGTSCSKAAAVILASCWRRREWSSSQKQPFSSPHSHLKARHVGSGNIHRRASGLCGHCVCILAKQDKSAW